MTLSVATLRAFVLPGALAMAATLGACQGCRGASGSRPDPSSPRGPAPTIRLYLLSSVAGALEPCGCSKNQLGGLDHFAAWVEKERKAAPASAVAAVGPLFFMDSALRPDSATQDTWKADALADGMKRVGLVAHAPGANDWAAGGAKLAELRTRAGASLLGGNLAGDVAGAVAADVREIGGHRVGFIGLAQPTAKGAPPPGVEIKPARERLAGAVADAKGKGAQILVGLFALPRGEALRLAESTPELAVVAVGKPSSEGETNDRAAPPVLLGNTLVVETGNHLQTVAVVDLHVADGAAGSFVFQDAAGLSRAAELAALDRRMDELRAKIRAWEQSPTIARKDLDARIKELEALEAQRRELETPPPPKSGSFFRYTMKEIREDLGRDQGLHDAMLAYYRKVNEHNQKAFAGRTPKEPAAGEARYIGVDACTPCHAAARAVWDKTKHKLAHKTLADQAKEFNLDCVSCHVTGYERPGGSTVTVNEPLRGVQCEECHGPGSKHRDAPNDKSLIVGKPKTDLCTTACHHPPHVDGFDPVMHMHEILGPGHGKVEEWPPIKAR